MSKHMWLPINPCKGCEYQFACTKIASCDSLSVYRHDIEEQKEILEDLLRNIPSNEDANLIAAAPDLLKATKVALWDAENDEYQAQKQGHPRLIDRLAIYRAAIAKAEGK